MSIPADNLEGEDPVALFGADRVAVMAARLESGRFLPEDVARRLLDLDASTGLDQPS